jgi:hypothetical protein
MIYAPFIKIKALSSKKEEKAGYQSSQLIFKAVYALGISTVS